MHLPHVRFLDGVRVTAASRTAGVRAGQDPSRLDGPAYTAGSALPTDGAGHQGTLRRAWFMVCHPLGLARYAGLVRRLPVVEVQLTDSLAGRYMYEQLSGQNWRRSASYAVLALPASHAEYLRGRSRQAVRTNLRRASAAGLFCLQGKLAPRDELRRTRQVDADDLDLPFVHTWSVMSPAGDLVGWGYALVDEHTALLRVLYATRDRSLSHQARFLLHTEIVQSLVREGVQILLLESIMAAPNGHKYFAARLGYRACRMKLLTRLTPSRGATAGGDVYAGAAVSAHAVTASFEPLTS